jgi:phosphate transport system substrate-binding protein
VGQALVAFAQSSQGQAIVAANGFIAQTVQAMTVTHGRDARGLSGLSRHAQRLTVNFRFEEGSASLDNKAHRICSGCSTI